MPEWASETIALPDYQGVTFSVKLEGLAEALSVTLSTASNVEDDLFATRLSEGILLEVEVLIFGRDPCVSNEHLRVLFVFAITRNVSKLVFFVKY